MTPPPVDPQLPSPTLLRAYTEEWLVAATIASEVPPKPTKSPHSQGGFTAEMIPTAIRAVCEVVANRRASPQFPNTALEVVLQPKQFSGVLRGVTLGQVGHRDFWVEAVLGKWFPDHVSRCLHEWRRVQRSEEVRVVPGALYYYSPVSMNPPHRVPTWAASLTAVPLAGVEPDYFRFFR